MTNRAIIIFPKFENSEPINRLREKYDPLYSCIEPHITLVFPFLDDVSKPDLIQHIETVLQSFQAFDLVTRGITGTPDGYIFLDVKQGNDKLIELHDQLYQGILKPHLNRFIPYTPHITVGRLFDLEKHRTVVESLSEFNEVFSTKVQKISVEIIDDLEKSFIEYEFNLA